MWTGAWRERGTGGRGGTVTFTVARANQNDSYAGVSGTVQEDLRGAGTVVGQFRDAGSCTIGFQYTGTGSGYYGTPSINAQGHLVGPLSLDNGDGATPTDFDLTRVTGS